MEEKKPIHYVKNKDLTAACTEYRNLPEFQYWLKRKRKSKSENIPFKEHPPPVTEYMASAFAQIAKKYARRPNFSGYTYIDDMISESTMLCIRYSHNFDPEKSNNAFSYFTQICHNGFLQVINRENKFAKFKFNYVKDINSKLGKMDYNDIKLYDEENPDLVLMNAQSEKRAAIIAENIKNL